MTAATTLHRHPAAALPDLLTPAQIARLGVLPKDKASARAVQRLVRTGQLPEKLVVRLGRKVYIRRAPFLAWARGEE